MITRRSFLSATAAAMPLCAKAHIDLSRISAITDEIARSSQAAVDFAKQYGLKWVELRNVPGERAEYAYLPEDRLRAEAKLLDENGLRVSFLNTSLMKVMIPGIEPVRWTKEGAEKKASRMKAEAGKFDRRLDDLKKGLHAAKVLGVDKMRVFTGWRAGNPQVFFPRVAEILNEMAEIAGKEKMHLLIENEGACNVGSCAELASIAKLVQSKWVGINWDPMNGMAFKEEPFPLGYNMLPKKRIWNVQIKGRTILDGPQKLDWKAILDALVKDGYKGQVGLETHIFGEGQIQASHDSMKEIVKIVNS